MNLFGHQQSTLMMAIVTVDVREFILWDVLVADVVVSRVESDLLVRGPK